ncbi:MAG TPA: cation:proton antiporter [Candidatus Thermoplasmatota archaeon]|nr:cation:proton antiporter [Candidatus Thermoplasmatota archaeon]
MAPVAAVFLAIAALVYAGFAAGRFFERTRFPDVPILLGLGLLLGPFNRWGVSHGWGSESLAAALDPAVLADAAPFIAALALVVLLFDSGMELDFLAFRKSLGPAFLHTLPILLLTVLGIAVLGHYVLGIPILVAVVLGVALVNVDQAVSSGVLSRLELREDLRAMYFVEMALYDLISIPLIVSLLKFAEGAGSGIGLATFAQGFGGMVIVSIFVGVAGGIAWIFALRGLKGHAHSYMLTFATTLGVYGASEFLGGSGAMSILLFGLAVGNRTAILRRFAHLQRIDTEHVKVQSFHDEVTFLVRTLFFLYLGIGFSIGREARWPVTSPLPLLDSVGTGPLFVVATLLVLSILVLARWFPVTAMAAATDDPHRRALFPVFGRGLDTAVLATLPFVAGAFVEGTLYHDTFAPWQPVFIDIALLTILLTVFVSSMLVWQYERAAAAEADAKAARARARERATAQRK